jgi:hypothetical protein
MCSQSQPRRMLRTKSRRHRHPPRQYLINLQRGKTGRPENSTDAADHRFPSSIDAFVQRLRELGWIENQTVAIEYRWAEGREERFAEIAAEFIRLKVDVIFTHRSKEGDGGRSNRVCRGWRPGRHWPCRFTSATGR